MSELLRHVASSQAEHLWATTSQYRRNKGQVFTPPEIATFMAGLFSKVPKRFRLLDPGAGAGSLAVAFCDRVLHLRSPRELAVECFENDPALVELLWHNLELSEAALRKAGHKLTFRVHERDFVDVAAPLLEKGLGFDEPEIADGFDGVITNPPYFKVRKESRHARIMSQVVHGQPNAYAFFLALSARLLREDGELVSITPRSFCNGLYFRGFRTWFFERMALDHIHLFESRTEAFRESEVLQESVITKSHRLGKRPQTVAITGSVGKHLDAHRTHLELPYDEVLDNSRGERLVKIPLTEADHRIMRLVEGLPYRFEETGLRISTGPVVTFRVAELLLREENGESAVPLLMSHNVRPFRTVWPMARRQHPLYILDSDGARKRRLLIPTRNYVILKRFSAKEEKRRLTAACLLGDGLPFERIGIENHLNYIYHSEREMSADEVFGVAALFNSELVDSYFRIISGNTQVNATEIRNLHFPDLGTVARIGRRVRESQARAPDVVERAVLSAFGATKPINDRVAAGAHGEARGSAGDH